MQQSYGQSTHLSQVVKKAIPEKQDAQKAELGHA